MKMFEVVTVVTTAGEFVGKFAGETEKGISLTDPRMLIRNSDNTGMGFAKGIAVSGKDYPTEVDFHTGGIVFVTQTNEPVEKAYLEFVSGIVLP